MDICGDKQNEKPNMILKIKKNLGLIYKAYEILDMKFFSLEHECQYLVTKK